MKKGKMIEWRAETEVRKQLAFLVVVQKPGESKEFAELMMDELTELVESINLEAVGGRIVRLRKPNARLFIGKGNAEEICAACADFGAEVIVFDDELSPYQQRNWEMLSNLGVIDRSQVIIDIFAKRAVTQEAKLQVRLAELRYGLPRLARAWTHLGRQAGGAGSGYRGGGEQQIELDRRMIREEIRKVEKGLKDVRRHRATQRKNRARKSVTTASIVGYTNAGKSSLLNRLTGAGVAEADRLFATLDPSTKPVALPENQTLLLTDTVGFVSKLPHLLVEAFKATLEEAVISDFLIHVVDVTSPYRDKQIEVTEEVLEEVGADLKDVLMVFNKVDLIDDDFEIDVLRMKYERVYFISAKTGEGTEELLQAMSRYINRTLKAVRLRVPQNEGRVISLLHDNGVIVSKEYAGNDILLEAKVPTAVYEQIEGYVCS